MQKKGTLQETTGQIAFDSQSTVPTKIKRKGKNRIDTTHYIENDKQRASVLGKKRTTYLKYAEQLNVMCGSDTLSVCINGSANKKHVRMLANGLLRGFEYSNLLEFIPQEYLREDLSIDGENLSLIFLLRQYMSSAHEVKQRAIALGKEPGEQSDTEEYGSKENSADLDDIRNLKQESTSDEKKESRKRKTNSKSEQTETKDQSDVMNQERSIDEEESRHHKHKHKKKKHKKEKLKKSERKSKEPHSSTRKKIENK